MANSDAAARIAILGAGGLLGSTLAATARTQNLKVETARSADVDARSEDAVFAWLEHIQPDALILNAAHTGGVHTNLAAPADMLSHNARIAIASIDAARRAHVKRLLYCASTIIYPDTARMPYREVDVGSGPMDATHTGYGAAKLLGVRFCQSVRQQHGLDYTSLILTNMYGPGQRYDPGRSNVVAGMLARFHEAQASGAGEVVVWGTGKASRDLLYVGDAADAILKLCQTPGPQDGLFNVASGHNVAIATLAAEIAHATGYKGKIVYDPTKPEGAMKRSIDISRLNDLGWRPSTSLRDGLETTYQAYLRTL